MTKNEKKTLFDRWRSEEEGMHVSSPEDAQEALNLAGQHHDELLRQARERLKAGNTETDEG